MEDALDGSRKRWYNAPKRMGRRSSFSKHIEDLDWRVGWVE